MVQIIIYLDKEENNKLKEMKKTLKISKADIIQNIIKEHLKKSKK